MDKSFAKSRKHTQIAHIEAINKQLNIYWRLSGISSGLVIDHLTKKTPCPLTAQDRRRKDDIEMVMLLYVSDLSDTSFILLTVS